MADLQQTIMGALQQAGLRDPAMLQQITASVMQGLGRPAAAPGYPSFDQPAPSELYGYEGQPDRPLQAANSYGRGPAPAPLDPREPAQMMSEIDAEQGWSPFSPPPMMPPGSPAMGPGVTASPPSGGSLLASDALRLRKPAAPGGKGKGKQAKAGLSESDRLNWQSYLASGGDPSRVPPQIRSLLSSGA